MKVLILKSLVPEFLLVRWIYHLVDTRQLYIGSRHTDMYTSFNCIHSIFEFKITIGSIKERICSMSAKGSQTDFTWLMNVENPKNAAKHIEQHKNTQNSL